MLSILISVGALAAPSQPVQDAGGSGTSGTPPAVRKVNRVEPSSRAPSTERRAEEITHWWDATGAMPVAGVHRSVRPDPSSWITV